MSFNNASTVPSGSASKASLEGANKVNGPPVSRVSFSSAALIAASKIVCASESVTISIIEGSNTVSSATIPCEA